jgi:nucleoid DNA-binding protein
MHRGNPPGITQLPITLSAGKTAGRCIGTVQRLKKDGEVTITNFGNFRIQKKDSRPGSYPKFNEMMPAEMNQIVFEPGRNFLENINSL